MGAQRIQVYKLPPGAPDFASLTNGQLRSMLKLYRHRLGYWRDKGEEYAAAVERGEIDSRVWLHACAEILRVHRLFMAAVAERNARKTK